MPTPEKIVAELREQIRRHDCLYYVEGRPAISDREYDRLFERLEGLEAEHPELITPDSPTQRVAGEPLEGFVHVAHARPMLSIDNTYNENELRDFDGRVAKGLGDQPYEYLVDPKVDGVSASLRYERGLLVLGATRGDGRTGDDITANIKTVRAVPLRLLGGGWPDVLEVRGEVFWPREEFDAYNKKRVEQQLEPFANPRNATAGTLKSLDSGAIADRGLSFVAHGLGEVVGQDQSRDRDGVVLDDQSRDREGAVSFDTAVAVFEAFRNWGIPVSPHRRVCPAIDQVVQFIKTWDAERKDLGYETDGLVIKVNRLDQRDALGATSRYPRWCIAYKYAAEQAESVLKSVDFQVGKLGTITPRAVMEPMQLSGTTVRHASLHNFDQVERLDVRLGDTVVVEKAGEIIPQVIRVVMEKRPPGAKRITPPARCPVCGGDVAKDEGGVYVRCINPACEAQIKERLKYFCGRNQMDIEGAGHVLIERLVDERLLRGLADLYHLHRDKDALVALDFPTELGEKSADNLLASVQKSTEEPLAKTLTLLEIPFLSSCTAELLASHFCSMKALCAATTREISEIEGIAPDLATNIIDFFNPRRPAELKDRLIQLHKRSRFKIDGLGPARIERLVDEGLLRCFGDLYRLGDHRHKLVSLKFENKFGEKNTANLLDSIEGSKKRPLSRMLAAINIRHVGVTTAELLAQHFMSIDQLLTAPEKHIRLALGGTTDTAATNTARKLHRHFRTHEISAILVDSTSSLRAKLEDLNIPCFAGGQQSIEARLKRLAARFLTLGKLSRASARDMTIAILPEAEKKVARKLRSFLEHDANARSIQDPQDTDLEQALSDFSIEGLTGTTRPAERRRTLARRFGTLGKLGEATHEDIEEALATEAEMRTAQEIHAFLRSDDGRRLLISAADSILLSEHLRKLPLDSLQVGKRTLDKRVPQLEEFFGDLETLNRASEEEIREALSEERAIASSVYQFFHGGGGERLIKQLQGVGVNMSQPKTKAAARQPLAGKTVVVTGTVQGLSRGDIEKLIKELGGKPSGSVSKQTDYLVAGAKPGSKLAKAESLGVSILEEKEFLRLIGRD